MLRTHLPSFEAVEGILHSLLVVFDHVGVHLWVVTPYVTLCAAIWDCTKAEWRVLFLRLLKLWRSITTGGDVERTATFSTTRDFDLPTTDVMGILQFSTS